MSHYDEFLELNAVYHSVAAENEALRALLTDYEAMLEDVPDESTENVAYQVWEARRIELKGRYEALVKGEQQS